jgi:hypothetical protein
MDWPILSADLLSRTVDKLLHWADQAAVLIMSDAPEDFPYSVDYTFTPTYTNAGVKKVK